MTAKDPNIPRHIALEALEKNLWALWSRFGHGDGCVLHEQIDSLFFDTPIPTLPYNSVIRFCVVADAERRIDAIFEHYRQRDVPFMWIIHPTSQPSDLSERLKARGLEEAELCSGMAMDLRKIAEPATPPNRIEIHEATTHDIKAILELVEWRWEVPKDDILKLNNIAKAFELGVPKSPIRCWIAFQDGVPVSKVLLNLAAGAAGIYAVATKPEARGLGLARTLTLHALHAARADGYQLGIVHSAEIALSLYKKIGFQTIAPLSLFAPPHFHV